jgi:hypothetical protein
MKFSLWLNEVEQQMAIPDAKNFAYLGCVLEKISQRHLIGLGQKLYNEQNGIEMPRDWIVRSHHMTVKFGPSSGDMQKLYNHFGQTVELHIKGFASDENCAAVIIQSSIPTENVSSHITIAHSRNVKPFYSTQLLMNKRKIINANDPIALMSVFLAVKHDQTQVWPDTGHALASPTLVG